MNDTQLAPQQKTAGTNWDYSIDWSVDMCDLGNDTIATSSWSVMGPDNTLILSQESIAEDNLSTTVWINGGTLNAFYNVTNTITTAGGRTIPRTFTLEIVDFLYLSQSRCM